MSDLKMYTDGCYFVIAESMDAAMVMIRVDVDPDAEEDEWSEWPGDKPFPFTDDDGVTVTKTAAEWCAENKPCLFGCTEDYC